MFCYIQAKLWSKVTYIFQKNFVDNFFIIFFLFFFCRKQSDDWGWSDEQNWSDVKKKEFEKPKKSSITTTASKKVEQPNEDLLIGKSGLRNVLPFRFYVKSIVAKSDSQKLPI